MQLTVKIEGSEVYSTKQNRREMLSKEIDSIIADGGLTGDDLDSLFTVVNHFSDGIYCRELHMPAGTKIVGKIHKTKHLNTLAKGECLVITTEREKHIEAPCTFESVEGEQKAILAITDVVWQTYHVTDKTDLNEIERDVIVDNFEQLDNKAEYLS